MAKDKLSLKARCVATLSTIALDHADRIARPTARVLIHAASEWDSKAPHIKWRAFGALQGAVDVFSEMGEWGEGPEGHGWALCDHAMAILQAEDVSGVESAIASAESYLAYHLSLNADLRSGRVAALEPADD